jgi:hypothetical protein
MGTYARPEPERRRVARERTAVLSSSVYLGASVYALRPEADSRHQRSAPPRMNFLYRLDSFGH